MASLSHQHRSRSGGKHAGLVTARVLLTCLATLVVVNVGWTEQKAPEPSRPTVALLSHDFQLYFIENAGQTDERVAYYVPGQTTSIYFTNEGLTYSLRDPQATSPDRWVLKQDFVGAKAVAPEAEDPTPATISYFSGNKTQWKAGLKTYTTVSYRDLWPGIDLEYSGRVHELKHSFMVRPGADPSRIRIRIRGATSAVVKNDGSLEIDTPSGKILDAAPFVYQIIDGSEVEIPAAYDLEVDPETGLTEYGFVIAEYDSARPLVIDPATFVYCGFIGGSESDSAYAIDVDDAGNAYVAGMTLSDQTTFPVNTGPDLTHNGGNDVFVAKVATDGSGLVWAGFIGGDGFELPWGIAVDSSGSAYVTGYTASDQTTFPITVGPDFGGVEDAFVAKVAPDGQSLVYCRYIGGTRSDQGYAIAVDSSGYAYLTGWTNSLESSFPVTPGSYRTTYVGGTRDAFVAKVDTDGDPLIFCTYLGSDDTDTGWDIAVNFSGQAFIAGSTYSNDWLTEPFPVTPGSFGETHCGAEEGFVTKLAADGASLEYSGLLCGSEVDRAYGIVIDASGAAYVGGETDSTETSTVPFPLVVGPDDTHAGPPGKPDGFVVKVAPDGGSLVYSGFIGGAGLWAEAVLRIGLDDDGNAYVTGPTWSDESTFPVLEGPDSTYNGNQDAFVARVRADGQVLDYAGYIGGTEEDLSRDIALDSNGDAYIVGYTASSQQEGFPVLVGPETTHDGPDGASGFDVFVAKITFCGHSTHLTSGTWAMISLPCDPGTNNSVIDLFGDDNLGTYGVDWTLLERDESTDSYRELLDTDTLEQGAGYWIETLVGDRALDVAGSHTATSADFDINLVSGSIPGRWNLVGHPYPSSVNWADVKVKDGGDNVYTMSQTQAASLINGRYMYKYNGSAFQTYHPDIGTPSLDLFDGIWVQVIDNATTLQIPATAAAKTLSTKTASDGWLVRMVVASGGLEDPENYLGRMSGASDGQDEYDLPELQPFAPPFLTMVFPHAEWSGDWWSYTADIREGRLAAGGMWDFEIRSDTARDITLNWAVVGIEPEILDRSILIDGESGDHIAPVAGGSYTTFMAAPTHRFSWRVNSLPQVDAGPDRLVGIGLPFDLRAAFSDEDEGDIHSATIDWGDGRVDAGAITTGMVTGSHTYNEVGDFVAEVCVEDDLGGRGCDDLTTHVAAVLFVDGFESGNTSAWSKSQGQD